MSIPNVSAGDHIATKCSKCGMETNHTIIAVVDELPAKVQCNTCNSEHKYRKPAAAKKATTPRKPATRRTKADPLALERQQWQEIQSSFDASKAVAYSMDGSYKVNALIKHPKFGIGKVQELNGTRKMSVLFEDGLKVLRCA